MHTLAARVEDAANSAPRFVPKRNEGIQAAARGFLIELVACEVQLADHGAEWLRAVGRSAGIGECEQLASEAVMLREELRVLVHRLVDRWNWLYARRRPQIDAAALLTRPMSPVVAELVALHERNVNGPTPWVELAALRPIEQMLAVVVPLAVDVAGIDDAELTETALLFEARSQRACELGTLLSNLIAADPRRATSIAIVEEQAVAAFTKVLAECTCLSSRPGYRASLS
jgi:hypothetical protein